MMDLTTLCFLMFAFLFVGFLILEGFDYGVGMLLPFLGRSEAKRQALIDTLAPVWEGNEVWLIAAGAVLFAGFPHVYATLFSGLYLALLFILISLIPRGIAFEFRNKDVSRGWRNFWDWAIFWGSMIPALLWGIAIASLLNGLPIDGEMQYTGTFRDLLSLYTLTSGLAFAFLCCLHGAAYLTLRLEQQFSLLAREYGLITGACALLTMTGFAVLTVMVADSGARPTAGAMAAAAVIMAALCCRCLKNHIYTMSFFFSTAAIIAMAAAIFGSLFPRFIISSLDPKWSLTIYNGASNPVTLKIMTVTMSVVLPVLLVFEGWKYYTFRERISVAETGFESRRKLWEQLRGRVKEIKVQACNLSVILEKTKYALGKTQSSQAGPANRIDRFKTLIQRGRQLANIMAAVLKLLRKR